MHQIFGSKENIDYTDREGAYLIPVHGNLIGIIKTEKGYFLIGGGLEPGEDHLSCIHRECLEETGYLPVIERKICSAETYMDHPIIGKFHPIQTYYIGSLLQFISYPSEENHTFCWMEYDQLRGTLFSEMQNWALEQISTLCL